MARRVFQFDSPDRFVAGTVGRPGARIFFLQARAGDRLVSVVLEKVQVAILAERLGGLLDELQVRGLAEPAPEAIGELDERPLEAPVVEAFRAETLTLGWDPRRATILLEARSGDDPDVGAGTAPEEDDDPALAGLTVEPDGADILRVRLSPVAARGFVGRALRVVAAGRPPCPLCDEPLDPRGHLCPRRNGQLLH